MTMQGSSMEASAIKREAPTYFWTIRKLAEGACENTDHLTAYIGHASYLAPVETHSKRKFLQDERDQEICLGEEDPEKSPLGALAFTKLIPLAGFPPSVVNIISGGADVGQMLASHMGIRKISFTRSVAGGRAVQVAAARSILERVTLELGGKSPALVFADADLKNAVDVCGRQLLNNSTQSCMAATRCLVQESVADEFVKGVKDAFEDLAKGFGDPADGKVMYGPLVDRKHYERVMELINGEISEAELVPGGDQVEYLEKGYFVGPTTFLSPNDDSRVYREEMFGLVLTIRTFKDEKEAITLANDTEYGLSSIVLTKSMSRALRVAGKMESGTVAVNMPFYPPANVPFGGWKQSGVGREGGLEGIMAYLQSKALLVNMDAEYYCEQRQ